MRVAIDGTPLLGPRTGVGWYTAELLQAMAERAPADEFAVLPISWRTAADVVVPERPNISVVRRFAPAEPLRLLWRRLNVPPIELFIRADVFHGTNFVAPPARRTPTVATVHDIGFVRFPDAVGPRERELVELLPRTLARTSAVIVVSEFTRRELLDWLPGLEGRVHVVANGPHERSLPPPEPAARPFALMLGSLNPRKNVELALDAAALLRDRGVELDLVLAGLAAPGYDVTGMIAARRLGDRVRLTGYADDDLVGTLLVSAAALAFPSVYEGFGMPLLEAMRARLPIAAVDAGATREVVGDAALLVAADATAFADALESAAFDATTRLRLIDAGTSRAATFSWHRAAEQTLAVYRSVL